MQAPGPDVFAIQIHAAPKRWIAPCRHLPQSGDSRQHVEPREVLDIVGFEIVEWMRPGAHQTHVAFQDVPKLGQLVEAVAPQDAPERRDSRVAGYFEEWTFALVAATKPYLQLVGVLHHGAKLAAAERTSFFPSSQSGVENWPRRLQLDQGRN